MEKFEENMDNREGKLLYTSRFGDPKNYHKLPDLCSGTQKELRKNVSEGYLLKSLKLEKLDESKPFSVSNKRSSLFSVVNKTLSSKVVKVGLPLLLTIAAVASLSAEELPTNYSTSSYEVSSSQTQTYKL